MRLIINKIYNIEGAGKGVYIGIDNYCGEITFMFRLIDFPQGGINGIMYLKKLDRVSEV